MAEREQARGVASKLKDYIKTPTKETTKETIFIFLDYGTEREQARGVASKLKINKNLKYGTVVYM